MFVSGEPPQPTNYIILKKRKRMVVNYTIEIKSVGTYSMEVGLPTEDFARDGTYDFGQYG